MKLKTNRMTVNTHIEQINILPELQSLIPPLNSDEFTQLEKNCNKHGITDPIIIAVWPDDNGEERTAISDGHNRYEIAKKNGLTFNTVNRYFNSFEDVKLWMISNQFGRRNLSTYDRSKLALQAEHIISQRAKKNKSEGGKISQQGCQISDNPVDTKKEVAKIAGVSHDTIHKVKNIEAKADEETKQKLSEGEISINAAYNDLKKKEKKEKRKQELAQQKLQIENNDLPIIDAKFDLLVLDPPWNYGREYDPESSRVANPYPEMTTEEIKAIELPNKDDSIIWLWTTQQFIQDAFSVLNHWGYSYKGILTWNKKKMGMGHWFRMQCEFCLLGIKGNPLWDVKDMRDIIEEPRREHSRKPDLFYKMIDEKFEYLSKIEYFSREKRDGWFVYGNDVNKF
jgi:N6-adenosine-specific RNA methylase IME4